MMMEQNTSGNFHTVYTGLLGRQLSNRIQSRILNGLYRTSSLNYIYEMLDVETQDIPSIVDALKCMDFRGFNVTIPGKGLMAYLADELTPDAACTKSVNTVLIKDNRLIGYNTEGTGFIKALKRSGFNTKGAVMTLLGCGSSARAIIVRASQAGFTKINVCIRPESRNRIICERTADICEASSKCKVSFYDYNDKKSLKYLIDECDILVNATTIGEGIVSNDTPVEDIIWLRPGLTVADMVETPSVTRLLSGAKEAGCKCISGLDMLLYQSSGSFRIWTGQAAREADLLSLYPLLY